MTQLPSSGATALGIELGSTRIKACLTDAAGKVLAVGGHEWENSLVDDLWSYSLDDTIGVSAMMHGYLAFDEAGELLVPFRTWRNVNTARAASELSEALDINIPLRWSIAHLHQAVLDREVHVERIAHVTTLAGYVHERLTGERVLGVGDASGVFPIDSATGRYDAERLAAAEKLIHEAGAAHLRLENVLPDVRTAGEKGGRLSADGAAFLDASGTLAAGSLVCPPEGDAGTGMVATNAVTPRTGNVSAGTSIFAMIVLENALASRHEEIDLVTTPAGHQVAMVHCNNGASEIGEWAGVFRDFARAIGSDASADAVFAAFLAGALEERSDDGIYSYNHLSGEPIVRLEAGRPLVARTPDSRLTLAGLARSQVRGSFATLALGMKTLEDEGVAVDGIRAHGGVFRTAGVAQTLLAEALGAPVTVGEGASEGGAWGMALLAAYALAGAEETLADWLGSTVFADEDTSTVEPDERAVAEHAAFLDRWVDGLETERVASRTLI
jgi:sugar (pentulose or hexulose) kinase